MSGRRSVPGLLASGIIGRMPYRVEEGHGCPAGKPWAVVSASGKRMGCHESKEKARAQLGALYVNEPGLKRMPGLSRRAMLQIARKYSPDQARDDHGRWTSGVGSENDPTVLSRFSTPSVTPGELDAAFNPGAKVTSIDEAVRLLGEGKGVMFERPEQAVTLVHRLAGIVQDAKAKGQQAPTFDLCKVAVANTNLFCSANVGIPRSGMPQLTGNPSPGSPADALPRNEFDQVDIGPAWRDSLIARGIGIEDTNVDASLLRASQNQLNGAKVANLLSMDEAGTLAPSRLFVSRDNYIVDGHHRWAADVTLGLERGQAVQTPVARVDMPVLKLLQDANNFAAQMGIGQQGVASKAMRTRPSGMRRSLLALKYAADQQRDDHGRFSGDGAITATADDAVAAVKEGATSASLYRAISESEHHALATGPLPAGQHNEERLGPGAAFAQRPETALHYVEPNVEHRLVRVQSDHSEFEGHIRQGAPGIFAIDKPITKDLIDKVSPKFTVSERPPLKRIGFEKRIERKYSPDQPRDERGRFGSGSGVVDVDTGAPGSHAVGVSADPNSQSLHTKTPGQQPGESDAAYNDRVFKDGMEMYAPATKLENAAASYRDQLGLVQPKVTDWRTIENPVEREKAIGAAFANAHSDPNDPLVQRAYKDLVEQTNDQWHLLTDPKADGGLGVKVDFVSPDQIRNGGTTGFPDPEGLNPYPTAADQRDDIVNNGHLSIASIADYPEAYHPILTNTRGGEYDTFRAVHDSFGHAAIGADFTRHGEYEAWCHHASMFYGDARQAASTELTGENSYLVTTHQPADHKAALLSDTLVSLPFDNQGNFDPNFYPGQVRTLSGLKAAIRAAASKAVGGEAEIVAKYGVTNSRNALYGAIARGLKGERSHKLNGRKTGMSKRRELKYSPDQERDDHGRFGSGGGVGGALADLREPDSGFTIDPKTGTQPRSGYAVALPGHSSITKSAAFFKRGADGKMAGQAIMKTWLKENASLFDRPGTFVGGWHDPAHDEIVLDPSQVVENRDEAMQLGKDQDQQAIADLGAIAKGDWDHAIISTGGSGGRTNG